MCTEKNLGMVRAILPGLLGLCNAVYLLKLLVLGTHRKLLLLVLRLYNQMVVHCPYLSEKSSLFPFKIWRKSTTGLVSCTDQMSPK